MAGTEQGHSGLKRTGTRFKRKSLMNHEPDLRFMERTFTGRPYGYGCLTPQKPIQPPGGSLNAVSRPQPIRDLDRDPGGHGSAKSNTRKALELLDWWDRLKEAFEELPGLWRSLLGVLATPIRWLISAMRNPLQWVGVAILAVGLLLFLAPMVRQGHAYDGRAEGEQLLGSARDYVRIQYSKTSNMAKATYLFEQEVDHGTFKGHFYGMEARMVAVNSDTVRIFAFPEKPDGRYAVMEFQMASGNSSIEWHEFRVRR